MKKIQGNLFRGVFIITILFVFLSVSIVFGDGFIKQKQITQSNLSTGISNALNFDGNNDVVTISSSSSLTIVTTITVEAWIKPNVTNNYGHIIDKSDELTNTNREWGFALDDFGGVDFGIWYPNSANLDAAISHVTISTSQWTHVAGVYDGSTIYVYQNGQLAAVATHTTEIPNTGIPVTIGNSASNNRPFNGLIDEVRVWNIPRSQLEIQSSMNCPLDGNEPGLVGYWKLDEGDGQVVNDASGNGNNGILGTIPTIDNNDPVWVESDLVLNCNALDSNDWPMYDHDLGHNCLSPDNELTPPFVQKWKFSSGLTDSYPAMHGPIIVGNKVYINFGNRMYALNTSDGSPIWHYDSDSYFDQCPAYSDGVIYCGAHNGKLYAINAKGGTLLSTYPTGGWVRGGPAVSNGIVYFTSFDGNIYAAQTSTLAPVWNKSIGEGNGIESAPAVADGVVYVGGGANVWALDAYSGNTIWKKTVDSVAHGSPAISGDMILTGTFGAIYALSKSDGHIIWSRTMNGVLYSPVISGNTAFVMEGGSGNVWALVLSTGSTIWESTLPTGYGAYIIGANGYLYIYTGTGRGFATVQMSDGYFLGETIGPDSLHAISNGVYYQGSVNGDLYAFVSQYPTTTSAQVPYIDFTMASDTGRFVYQFPPNLAGAGKPDIHWLSICNGDSGILEIQFTGPNQGVNMTLEIPEWFSADSGQWYLLKTNVSSSIPITNTLSVGGALYNGVPPGESALNVDLLVSVKKSWSLLRSYRESYKNQSMYPQLMIRNNNVFPASIYIDYIQVKKVSPPSD